MLGSSNSTKLAGLFQALSDSTRIKIIFLLDKKPHCVFELVQKIPLSQPTISKHLKILKNAKLVSSNRKKQKIFYSLEKEYLKRAIAGFLNNLLN